MPPSVKGSNKRSDIWKKLSRQIRFCCSVGIGSNYFNALSIFLLFCFYYCQLLDLWLHSSFGLPFLMPSMAHIVVW